mgnify:CR=1 FL=1
MQWLIGVGRGIFNNNIALVTGRQQAAFARGGIGEELQPVRIGDGQVQKPLYYILAAEELRVIFKQLCPYFVSQLLRGFFQCFYKAK